MGWSSFSQEAIIQPPGISVMMESYVVAQSNALVSTGLQKHGYNYVNLDAGWSGPSDQYGRPTWDPTKFPHFLQMIQDMHSKGQKIGIYLNPGVGTSLVQQN
jgi:alpha-glucosidase (family GH31 glycosyl hydrolase)